MIDTKERWHQLMKHSREQETKDTNKSVYKIMREKSCDRATAIKIYFQGDFGIANA